MRGCSPSRLAVLSVLLAAIAGCSFDDGSAATAEPSSTTIPTPSTLVQVAVEEWPRCVNPLTCADDALREQVLQHVLPVAFELDDDDEYRPSPLLAATPEPEALDGGGVAISYEIDPAARWADGRPITSSDFLATWLATMSTPGAATRGYDSIVSVDDADPRTAVVRLDTPLVDWRELFGGARGFLLQADALGASTDLTGRFEDALPMAAGPYRLASWDEDRAVLAAVDPWETTEAPEVDQVQYTRVDLGTLGDPMRYDLLVPSEPTTVEAPEGFEEWRTPTTSVLGVWLDQREPLLQPLQHRQVVDVLLDREELVEAAGGGDVVACPGWVPGIGPWCEAGTVSPPEPNHDLARFVLAAEGWVADEEGVLVRGEERFSLPLTHDPSIPGAAAVADALGELLVGIGIEARDAELPADEWRAARPGEASAGVGIFAVDLGVSPTVRSLYGCPDGPATSAVAACPEELIRRARSLDTERDASARDTVSAIASQVAADVLWVPLRRVEAVSYVRTGRLAVPDSGPSAGGPLARLDHFGTEG